jgi:thiamine biosynthesis lipoprotein
MNKSVVLALIFILASTFEGCAGKRLTPSAPPKTAEVTRSFYLMGTYLDVVVQAQNRELALTASDAVFQTVRNDEKRLSTWTAHSELSTVNKTPVGKEAKLSPLLERDLKNAYRFAQETGFTFTPWIGPMVKAWHIRSGGRIPTLAERNNAMKASQPNAFRLTEHGVIKELPGANIEEGGFGKGIALDDAVNSLVSEGVTSAVLNFGGQVLVYGDTQVPIEIADPSKRTVQLLRFASRAGSISTSGNAEHGMVVKQGNSTRKIGHLLDPRSGSPAPFEGSATVIAPTGVEADCLSAAVFILGPEKGLEWARDHHAQVLWIRPAGKPGKWIAETSCDWKQTLEKMSSNVTVISGRTDCKKSG